MIIRIYIASTERSLVLPSLKFAAISWIAPSGFDPAALGTISARGYWPAPPNVLKSSLRLSSINIAANPTAAEQVILPGTKI